MIVTEKYIMLARSSISRYLLTCYCKTCLSKPRKFRFFDFTTNIRKHRAARCLLFQFATIENTLITAGQKNSTFLENNFWFGSGASSIDMQRATERVDWWVTEETSESTGSIKKARIDAARLAYHWELPSSAVSFSVSAWPPTAQAQWQMWATHRRRLPTFALLVWLTNSISRSILHPVWLLCSYHHLDVEIQDKQGQAKARM